MPLAAVLVLLAVAAAGCGGSSGGGGGESTDVTLVQDVNGPGFTFRALQSWPVTVGATSAVSKKNESTLVSVVVTPLLKPYRPALFPKVVTELDRVAGELAGKLGGKVTSKTTTIVAGRKARSYDIAHGDLVDRITFVLKGKSNYQLTCRWSNAGGVTDGCGLLATSFRFR